MAFPRNLPRTLLALLLAAASPASSALAQGSSAATPASKHPLTVYIEGVKSKDAEELVKSTLPDSASFESNDAFKKAAQKRGQRFPLGIPLTLESKRQPMLEKLGKAASEASLEIVILGLVRPSKPSGQELVLLVLEAGKDSPSIDTVIKLGQSSSKADVEAAMKDLYESWRPAAVVETPIGPTDAPDKPKEEPEEKDDWERPKNVFGHEIFQVSVAFDVGGRFFDYNDGLSPNLRDYSVFGAPGLAATLSVYPLAPTGIVVLRDLGLYGDFRIALGLSSATAAGDEVGTTWLRGGGGLRYRLPLGPKDAPYVLGFRGGFHRDGFVIEEAGSIVGEAPTVEYMFLRGGLDARIPLGPIAITAFGSYLGAVSAGEVYDRFREPSIGGIDVGGGLTVPIVYGLEARLQAEYVRWFYAFGPVPGDDYVAGGALDQQIHIELGPQYVF